MAKRVATVGDTVALRFSGQKVEVLAVECRMCTFHRPHETCQPFYQIAQDRWVNSDYAEVVTD